MTKKEKIKEAEDKTAAEKLKETKEFKKSDVKATAKISAFRKIFQRKSI